MDLDDLKTEWTRRDQALQQTLEAQRRVLRDMTVERLSAKLRRGGMSPLELIVWGSFVVGFGAFLAGHVGDWKFFIPALLLDIWTIAMGVMTFRERAQVQAVDLGAPLIEVQERLGRLRVERARTVQWAFLTGQVLWWIPFVIVLFKGLLGVDLYAVSDFMPRFMLINILVGLAAIPLILAASRWLGPRLAGSPLGRSFLDAITGRDLAEANALAARIARFDVETRVAA